MPVPILAAVLPAVGGVLKTVGSKIGGFFKKLFGGKKKRRAQRAAAKAQRIRDSSERVFAKGLAKLENAAMLGEATAKLKLAKVEKQLAKQGIFFDPGIQDATVSDLKFNIPEQFRKVRMPGVFQQNPQLEFQQASVLPVAGGLGNTLKEPLVLVVIGAILLFILGKK